VRGLRLRVGNPPACITRSRRGVIYWLAVFLMLGIVACVDCWSRLRRNVCAWEGGRACCNCVLDEP